MALGDEVSRLNDYLQTNNQVSSLEEPSYQGLNLVILTGSILVGFNVDEWIQDVRKWDDKLNL